VEINPSTSYDQASRIIIDAKYIYIGGSDYSPGDRQWRIEKRDITTGALVTAFQDGDEPGVVESNPTSNGEFVSAIAIDSNYIYAGGGKNDYAEWRIEKRDITTGALVTAFDSDGVVDILTGEGYDALTSIAVDSNYIYAGGYDEVVSGGRDYVWRIEKRDINTGALVTAFDSDGVVESDPSSYDYLYSMDIDSNYIYAGGVLRNGLGNFQWRIEKRDINTGALVTAFDSDGVIDVSTSGSADLYSLVIGSGHIYTAGYAPGSAGNQWRIEKRDITTGALVNTTAYATSGTFTSQILDTTLNNAFNTIAWDANTPADTTVTIKVRSCDDDNCSGETAIDICPTVTNGQDITDSICVTDGDQYVQYYVSLTTSDTLVTSTLNEITINYSLPIFPTTSNFTSEETTNFSTVDITNVTSMTLAITGKGKIKFPVTRGINAENENYDTNIIIEDEFISVNTAALDSTFNSSATITLEGVSCPVATITYQEGTFTSKDDIIAGGNNCELDGVCSNIQCIGTTLTFDVAHFTGFAAGADANLTTKAEAGVFYPLDSIEFTAEYINSTDGTPISGECNITFDDDWDTEYTMDFDTDYNYTKSFATAGTHEYNVTCSSANFVTLEANDTKLVTSVDIPEFSVLTLGLGLIAVLVGLFVIRRKK